MVEVFTEAVEFLAVNRSDSIGMKTTAAATHRRQHQSEDDAGPQAVADQRRALTVASACSGAPESRAVTPTACTPPLPNIRGCRTLILPRTVLVWPAGTTTVSRRQAQHGAADVVAASA